MTSTRHVWEKRLRDLMEGRPVRWATGEGFVGDYDGRERTIEVFNADALDQRALLRRLRPVREELELAVSGPVVVVFHTTKESARLYAAFVEAALQAEADADVVVAEVTGADQVEALALDKDVKRREEGSPGSGSTELPRVTAAAA
jgi:hypothetical protein